MADVWVRTDDSPTSPEAETVIARAWNMIRPTARTVIKEQWRNHGASLGLEFPWLWGDFGPENIAVWSRETGEIYVLFNYKEEAKACVTRSSGPITTARSSPTP